MTCEPTISEAVPVTVRRRRRVLLGAGRLLILGLVAWFLVRPQLGRSTHSLHLLVDVDSGWIPLALLAELVSLCSYAAATRAMLPRERRPAIARMLGIDLSAIAVGHCLPDGGAAGTATCWRLLVRSGVPSADAAFAKLTQGLVSAVVLQGGLLIAYLLTAPFVGLNRWNLVALILSITVVVTAALTWLSATRPHAARPVSSYLARLPGAGVVVRRTKGRVTALVSQQFRAARDERRILGMAKWALSNWLFDAVALWAALHAYGHGVSLAGLALAFGVANTFTWIPLTPSGLGLSEAVMIPALVAFGSPRSVAVLGVLTWRLVAYWLPIPLGAIAYGAVRHKVRAPTTA